MTTKDQAHYALRLKVARRDALLLNKNRHKHDGSLQCEVCRRTHFIEKVAVDVFHKRYGQLIPGVPLDQDELEVLCGECFEVKHHHPHIDEHNFANRIQMPLGLDLPESMKDRADSYAQHVANEAYFGRGAKKRR